MEMEILNLPHARSKLTPKLRGYSAEVEKLKQDLVRGEQCNCKSYFICSGSTLPRPPQKRVVTYGSAGADRKDLLGTGDPRVDLDVSSMDQRTRLMAGTDRLQATSRRLEESHRLALETEEVGRGIL
ncbi:MAG: hypothetical protein BJ554DRAFT_747, partial [Olpidium bornovanus]